MQLYNKNIKKGKYIKCLIKKRIHCIEQLKKEKPRMKRPLDTGKIYCEQYAVSVFFFCFVFFLIFLKKKSNCY